MLAATLLRGTYHTRLAAGCSRVDSRSVHRCRRQTGPDRRHWSHRSPPERPSQLDQHHHVTDGSKQASLVSQVSPRETFTTGPTSPRHRRVQTGFTGLTGLPQRDLHNWTNITTSQTGPDRLHWSHRSPPERPSQLDQHHHVTDGSRQALLVSQVSPRETFTTGPTSPRH